MPGRGRHLRRSGFTLVEALITVAIIGVMAAAVISAFSNAANDSRRVIGRQQQAVVQAAVNNWVTAEITAGNSTIAATRSFYNYAGANPKTSLERLTIVSAYLDEATFADLTNGANGGSSSQIKSDVLAQANQYLELPLWVNGSYPKVNLKP